MRDELARSYAFMARGDMGGTRVVSRRSAARSTPTSCRGVSTATTSGSSADAEPEELVAEAKRLERRLIFVPDPELGDALTPWFEEQGWRIDRHVVMAQLREPGEEADLSLVRELESRTCAQARKRVLEPTSRGRRRRCSSSSSRRRP